MSGVSVLNWAIKSSSCWKWARNSSYNSCKCSRLGSFKARLNEAVQISCSSSIASTPHEAGAWTRPSTNAVDVGELVDSRDEDDGAVTVVADDSLSSPSVLSEIDSIVFLGFGINE